MPRTIILEQDPIEQTYGVMTRATMLDSFECQEFAFQVMQHGNETLDSCLRSSDALDKSQLPKCIMACEIVAAAGGHPVKEKQWCFFAEQWLYESKYKPDPEDISNATRLAKQVAKQNVDYDIKDLIARLEATPKKTTFKKAIATPNDIGQVAKETADKVHWDRKNKRLSIRLEDVAAKLHRIISFQQFKSVNFVIEQPPNENAVNAFRMLLLACKESLEKIEFSRSIPQGETDTDPLKILKTSTNEIAGLESLTGMLCDYVYADNSVIEAATRFGAVRVLRFFGHKKSKVDAKALPFLLKCKNLRMVNIGRAGFPDSAALKLNKAMPDVNILGQATEKIVTPEWAR